MPVPGTSSERPLLWAQDLHYAHQGSPALLGVSLQAHRGEVVAVTGARGCGKSTLLRCLAGHLLPQRGEVWYEDIPLHTLPVAERERLRRDLFGWIGSVPQLVPELTVWENVALPLLLRGSGHRAARRAAHEWLERLEIADRAASRPADLLQGQRQRIALARALVHSPTLLFADEPTAPLHRPDRVQVLRTLTAAARTERVTVLLALHDPAASAADARSGAAITDHVVTLDDGRRVDTGAAPHLQDGTVCSLSV